MVIYHDQSEKQYGKVGKQIYQGRSIHAGLQ